MRDQLVKDIENLDVYINGTAKQAAQAADSLGGSIEDLVQAIEQIGSIVTDVVDRLVELEGRVKALDGKDVT